MNSIITFIKKEIIFCIAVVAAIITCFIVPPDEQYLSYINWRTLAVLYCLTPGWFDDINVENFTFKWKYDKAESWTPEAIIEDGYLTWTGSLSKRGKFPMDITYKNDAYGFDLSKNIEEPEEEETEGFFEIIGSIFGSIFALAVSIVPFFIIGCVLYAIGSGLKGGSSGKKYKRTIIKYYHNCPGCGAARTEGKDECEYCGGSMIESEEIVEEKDDENVKKFKNEGVFRYGDSPDTYIRVHVIPVVTRSHSSGGGGRSSGGGSSCACVSSCACACACACAGGGRAGCSNKDFYNTKLKLAQIERAAKAGKTR